MVTSPAFDAPIPGQSLTMPKGSMPMERPPQFTDPNDALEYLFNKLTAPKQAQKLLAMLKTGAPVEYITRSVLFEGVMQGKWSPDLALLMSHIVMWQIEAIAKLKGINPTLRNPDPEHDKFMAQFADLLDAKKDTATEAPAESPGFFFKGLK